MAADRAPHPAMPDRSALEAALLRAEGELASIESILDAGRDNLPEQGRERIDDILAKRHQEAARYTRELRVTLEMIGACFHVYPHGDL